MPTLFVGVHLALAALLALFGLSFIADPCGGGGDLCLGGIAALFAFAAAGLGALGLVIWRLRRRASPLIVWDSALLALSGFVYLSTSPYGPTTPLLGAELIALFGLLAAALAGMAVVTHRIERLLVVAALVAIAVLGGEGGIAVLGIGLLALGVGWLFARSATATTAGSAGPTESAGTNDASGAGAESSR